MRVGSDYNTHPNKKTKQNKSQQAAAATIQKAVKKALASQSSKYGGMAGKAVGRMTGMPGASRAGKIAGQTLGSSLGRLIGSGDYSVNTVTTNSLFGSGAVMGSFGSPTRGVRFTHREFVTDVTTGPTQGAFVNQTFRVNPGNEVLVPLLSQIALNFEEYKVHGIVFQFVSSTSPYLAAGALGTYVMTMAYNASAPPFTSKVQAENSDYALSERLDRSAMYGVECAKDQLTQPYYYVAAAGISTPINLTDIGLFQFCVAPGASVPASTTIGELWISYDIEFTRPRLGLTRLGYFHTTRTDVVQTNNPLGQTESWEKSFGTLANVSVTGTVITFPDARLGDIYEITVGWVGGAALGAVTTPIFTPVGMTPYNLYNAGLSSGGNYGTNVASASTSRVMSFRVTAAPFGVPPTLTAGLLGVLPTAPYMDLIVNHLGNGFANGSL